jgi:hypothetical protein
MPVFKGFIKDVKYHANLTSMLESYGFEQFDINETKSVGLVQTSRGTLAFSKWVSPKPTRSYPFERIYNTYNNQKIITIIPIIKDEGIDGDSDFISYKTFSWMSLLNVYVILAYYSSASKRPGAKQKITNQKFDVDFIRDQIDAITQYKQSALHWNRTLLKDQFTNILKLAIRSYQEISVKTRVGVHDYSKRLSDYLKDLEAYQKNSLDASRRAAHRETSVNHALEVVDASQKYVLEIENYLGGIYSLSPDAIVLEAGTWIILESKNTSKGKLPQLSDIKDGLFKLILFSNLDRLDCDGVAVEFKTRLQLTGNDIQGQLKMPCSENNVEQFLRNNTFSKTQQITTKLLNQEAQSNPKLEILIESNGVK